jgi:hypothetical protein
MAFDEALAARAELSERKMFGGIAFMLAGNNALSPPPK